MVHNLGVINPVALPQNYNIYSVDYAIKNEYSKYACVWRSNPIYYLIAIIGYYAYYSAPEYQSDVADCLVPTAIKCSALLIMKFFHETAGVDISVTYANPINSFRNIK